MARQKDEPVGSRGVTPKKMFPKNAGISEQRRKMVQNAAKKSPLFAASLRASAKHHNNRSAKIGLRAFIRHSSFGIDGFISDNSFQTTAP
jgi:hypothetical protein